MSGDIMWQDMRDPNAKTPKKPPTNTFKLDDNCYYVTIAKMLDTSVEKLMDSVELMQIGGGAKKEQIEELLNSCKRANHLVDATSLSAAEDIALKNNGGFSKRFGIAFSRTNGTGHVVVMQWNSYDQVCEYWDYQLNDKGDNAKADVSSSIPRHVFWFEGGK